MQNRTQIALSSITENQREGFSIINSFENKSEKRLKAIGWRIGKVRQDLSLTQEEFADKLGYARSTLAKLEAGLRDIKSTEILELAEKLGVSCDYLLGRTMATAPDNIVQEMVDRYGLSEDTLKTLHRLKDTRKNQEDFIYANMAPSENWEQLITRPDIREHVEHDERILKMLNLLFTTKRGFSEKSNETHGEYVFYTLYKYFYQNDDNDNLQRAIDMMMIHEDIVVFGKTLNEKR
jgi:transcriptional regulator with XRE-family HTH domain